jgi:NAD(P)H-hydrate repair Nnr-like enzyme with NAD(P)H-hydrate epimerase domain
VLVKLADVFRSASAHQLGIARAVGFSPVEAVDEGIPSEGPDLIFDGMVGYGFSESRPRGVLADAILWARAQSTPIFGLDIPSGMDATTGECFLPVIQATATLTLALLKKGLIAFGAEELVGELYLADIGIQEIVYRKFGVEVGPLFSGSDLLRFR